MGCSMVWRGFGIVRCCHVEWAIRQEILDRLTCSARWWSISILWLILFTQCDFVAWVVVVLPPMARSQCRTQMRWAVSEMSMCRRWEVPRVAVLGRCWVMVDRELQPRMVPIMMHGQGGGSDGQQSTASCQRADLLGLLHSSRICSRVSVWS